MKFRKKPVVIEAMQFTGKNKFEVTSWAINEQGAQAVNFNDEGFGISTLEGTMLALPGDWIIKGVKNEFYPCKPDIFEMTYEAVND